MSCQSSFKNCKHFRLKTASKMVWISLGNLPTTVNLCWRKTRISTNTLRVITGGYVWLQVAHRPSNQLLQRPQVKNPIVFVGREQWGDLERSNLLCLYSSLGSCVHAIYGKVTEWTGSLQVSAQASLSEGDDPDDSTLASNTPIVPALFSLQLASSWSASKCQDQSSCARGCARLRSVNCCIPSTKDSAWHMAALDKRALKWTNCNMHERSQWFYLQRRHSQLVSTSSLSDFG